ncbi:MAG: DUF5684 domain-containing protein [Patescibacteria group bacterium]
MIRALEVFAQNYTYYTFDGNTAVDDGGGGLSAAVLIPLIMAGVIVGVVSLVSLWKIFQKAGQPGWAAIVPVYNAVILLQIVGRPLWWIVFYLLGVIPFVGYFIAFVASVIVDNDLAKSFGKDTKFTVMIVLLPFIALPMLAFGDAKYKGPAALAGGPPAPSKSDGPKA